MNDMMRGIDENGLWRVLSSHLVWVSYRHVSWDPDLWRTLCQVGAIAFAIGGIAAIWAALYLPPTLVKNSRNYSGNKTPQEREKMLSAVFWTGAVALLAVAAANALIARFVIPPPA